MRIALVTEFYYPHLGGVTEHVHNLALQLIRRGHTAMVITGHMTGARRDPEFVHRIGTSRIIYSSGSFARVTSGLGLRRQLVELFRAERFDVVHVHGGLAPTFGLVAPEAAHDVGIPVVSTFHSWFPRSALCRIFRRPLQRRLDRYAAAIAVSQPVVDAHARYFNTRWDIIPNGIDVEFFHPNGGAQRTLGRQSPRLLFLGRLDPRNGLDTALGAMPAILREYPSARLVVAGDGPLRGYYERMAAPVARQVDFIGQVNGDRPHHYATADIYLCPTTKASFGITLLEAMACGTPLVVSDITGFRELVDGGQEAVMVPMNDPGGWADATLRLLADPDRRAAMGRAGRAKAEAFAWPSVADRVFAVYRRVTA